MSARPEFLWHSARSAPCSACCRYSGRWGYRCSSPAGSRDAASSPVQKNRAALAAPFSLLPCGSLAQVLADQLGHVEHRHLRLAAEHGLQLVVGIDHALVVLVLQA